MLSNAGVLALEGAKQAAWDEFSSRDRAAWRLARDATWEELQIEFTAEDVANVRFRRLTRRFEPEHLEMKDGRTGQPTSQWALLRTFAVLGGSITPKFTPKHSNFLKHKQGLSARLRRHFGLPDDPIPYDKRTRTFTTKFVIRDHRRTSVRTKTRSDLLSRT